MKVQVLPGVDQSLQWEDRPDPHPGPGEVVVRLRASALNRRDDWITKGLYPRISFPAILGSDGSGVVTDLGAGVSADWQGREVIINPGLEWGDSPSAQGRQFHILGMPQPGTFATHLTIDARQLHPRPAHLDWHESAALPLAGLTAFRALFLQGGVRPGEKVLVTGIGGGVSTFVLQFAIAAGATVAVTSSSAAKIERAIGFGAAVGVNYRSADWHRQLLDRFGPVDLTIDSAGGDSFGQLLDVATPGGRIVVYGATNGPPAKLDLFKVFWKQLRIIGSTMGSPNDFAQMLQLVYGKQIRPVVDTVLPLNRANEAFDRLRQSSQFGKIVLDNES